MLLNCFLILVSAQMESLQTVQLLSDHLPFLVCSTLQTEYTQGIGTGPLPQLGLPVFLHPASLHNNQGQIKSPFRYFQARPHPPAGLGQRAVIFQFYLCLMTNYPGPLFKIFENDPPPRNKNPHINSLTIPSLQSISSASRKAASFLLIPNFGYSKRTLPKHISRASTSPRFVPSAQEALLLGDDLLWQLLAVPSRSSHFQPSDRLPPSQTPIFTLLNPLKARTVFFGFL